MENLYAPWRDKYFNDDSIDGCIFCYIQKSADIDKENYVLFRDSLCYGVMNLYPYAPAHFMVVPNMHTDSIENLSKETWKQMSFHVQSGVRLLKDGFGAQGANIGMNLGEAGGAGICEHVHYHILPRWKKDTNFITSISNTRVYPSDFEKIYNQILSLVPKYFNF